MRLVTSEKTKTDERRGEVGGFLNVCLNRPGAASLGISGCDGDGSDVRLRSFLLAPKCPLERELATRFLGRS